MGRRTPHDCHTFAPSSNLHRPQVDEWGSNRGLSGRIAGGSEELGPSRVRFTTRLGCIEELILVQDRAAPCWELPPALNTGCCGNIFAPWCWRACVFLCSWWKPSASVGQRWTRTGASGRLPSLRPVEEESRATRENSGANLQVSRGHGFEKRSDLLRECVPADWVDGAVLARAPPDKERNYAELLQGDRCHGRRGH